MYYIHASNWNRSTTARHKAFFCFVSFFLFLLIYTTAEVISTLFQFVSFPAVSVLVVFSLLLISIHQSTNQPKLNWALTMGVQNARNRPKQDSGNNSPEPEGNERRSHRKSPSSASNCSSSSSSVVHEKVSCRPFPCLSSPFLHDCSRVSCNKTNLDIDMGIQTHGYRLFFFKLADPILTPSYFFLFKHI